MSVYVLLANMTKTWYDTIQVVSVSHEKSTCCEMFKRHVDDIIDDYVTNDDYGSINEEYIRDDIRIDDLAKELINIGECAFSIGDDDFSYTLKYHNIE